jgi:hypothetical protein
VRFESRFSHEEEPAERDADVQQPPMVEDRVAVLQLGDLHRADRRRIAEEVAEAPVLHADGDGEEHEHEDAVVREKVDEAHAEALRDDDVRRVADERRRASDGRRERLREVEGDGGHAHLLAEGDGDWPEEHDARDVVEEGRHDSGEHREQKEDCCRVAPRGGGDAHRRPLEHAGERQKVDEYHHREEQQQRAPIDVAHDRVQLLVEERQWGIRRESEGNQKVIRGESESTCLWSYTRALRPATRIAPTIVAYTRLMTSESTAPKIRKKHTAASATRCEPKAPS